MRKVVALAAVFAGLCAMAAAAGRDGPRFASDPAISENPNDRAPLAALVRFEADEPVSTTLAISDGTHDWKLRYDASRDPAEGLPVVGMRPDRRHRIDVTIRDEDGNATAHPGELTFTTPALPHDVSQFPKIAVDVSKPGRMEPGVTLFNPRRRIPAEVDLEFNKNFGLLVAVDHSGEVVWYYRSGARISDFKRLSNGHFAFITHDSRLVEIDLLGNVRRQWYAAGRPSGSGQGTPVDTLTFHHSFEELPNGNFIVLGTDRRRIEDYYTSEWDADAPRKDQWVMGDEIVIFRPDGEVVWRWNAFEHLDPRRIGYLTFSGYWKRRGWPDTIDWSHANSVQYLEDDRAVLCNFRLQSAIVRIDRPTGDTEWIAGEHSGWSERLRDRLLDLRHADRWFWHQHDPGITPRGTLLLFDNNNFEARPFEEPEPPADIRSRAAEYRLDPGEGTLTQVWTSEIPGEAPHASWAMGSVEYLPQRDNVLVGYGFMIRPEDLDEITWRTRLQFNGWTQLREYTHESPPEVLWQLSLHPLDRDSGIGWNCFGAHRLRAVKMP